MDKRATLIKSLGEMVVDPEFWPSDESGEPLRQDFATLHVSAQAFTENQAEHAALAVAGTIQSMMTTPGLYQAGDLVATIRGFHEILPRMKYAANVQKILLAWIGQQHDKELATRIGGYLATVLVNHAMGGL